VSVFVLRSSASIAQPGFDYFIGPSGSDGNAGSQLAPWAITALSSKSQIAGKRVGLLDGTYVLQNSGFQTAAQLVTHAGSSGSPTVVEAVNPRLAVLSGYNGSTYSQQALLGTQKAFVTFKNLKFEKGIYKFLLLDSAANFEVTGCEFADMVVARHPSPTYGDNQEGIRIENMSGTGNPANGLIENCYFHDIYNLAGGVTASQNASGVKTYDVTTLTLRKNTYANTGVGVFLKYNSAAVLMEFEFYLALSQAGVLGLGGDDDWSQPLSPSSYSSYLRQCVFVNLPNKLWENGQTGSNTHVGQQTYCHNHSVYAPSMNDGMVHDDSDNAGLYRCYNNALQVATWNQYGVHRIQSAADVAVMDYNRWSAFKATLVSSTTTNLATWQGHGVDANSTTGSCGFVNAGGVTADDYKLSGASACLNAGRVDGVSAGNVVNQGAYLTGTEIIGHRH
jgi:hypothetical protein